MPQGDDSRADLGDGLARSLRSRDLGLNLVSGAIAALVASPLVWIVLRASDVDPDRAWSLLTWSRNLDILMTTVGLVGVVTAGSLVIGVPVAFLTTRTDLPFRRFWTIIAALPLVVPSYLGAFALVSVVGPFGAIDSVAGIDIPQIHGFWGAALVITLYTYPYVFLTTRAALISMDPTLIDAARTLNETWAGAFRRVTLPQIRPAIAAGALLSALYAVSDFGTPTFMRLEVMTSAIYWEYEAFNVDYAALLSLQLLAVAAVILAIEARIGQDDPGGMDRGVATQIQLGRWRWPALVGLAGLGTATLLAPIAIFGRWFLVGPDVEVSALAFELEYATNSVLLATLAAIVAACFAVPVAYHAAKSDRLSAQLFERITYVGFAVPGIVIGLALVFLGLTYVPWVYRTIPLLVFAYVVRFLPQAVGITRSSVLQVDPRTIEAARTLDAGPMRTFGRITLPLIAPGVVAGAALVFLTTMKELPATLMLQPIGMETLVTIIWAAWEEVHYAYAAIPALVLILISGISMAILLWMEEYELGRGNA